MFLRFLFNGLFATVVHFAALFFLVEFSVVPSAGVANGFASAFGIASSFIGNKLYVFPGTVNSPFVAQVTKFVALYSILALMNFAAMTVFADIMGLSYKIGFLACVILQVGLSYLGNKYLVFVR